MDRFLRLVRRLTYNDDGVRRPGGYGPAAVRQPPIGLNLRGRDRDRAGYLVVRENQSHREPGESR
jgi:hypothetical protein